MGMRGQADGATQRRHPRMQHTLVLRAHAHTHTHTAAGGPFVQAQIGRANHPG